MKILWVGDPHVEPHDLADAAALGKLIIETADKNNAMVVMAGDLYHTHAIIHAEVQFFWYMFFEVLRKKGLSTIVLKGNHDAPGTEGSKATALIAHIEQATMVLHKPYEQYGLLFCPYTSNDRLAEWSGAHPTAKTLFCHQTINGSKYENGFFAKDGIDLTRLIQPRVISGHIHAPQEFDKVWYPGAPRWKTISDANTERAIWLLDFEDGILQKRTPVDTGAVCRKIFHLIDTPTAPVTITPDPRHEYRVDSHGPAAWLEDRKAAFAGWARWHPVKTDPKVAVVVKESEGVAVAFDKWLGAFQPKYGTEREILGKMVKERVNAF